MVPEDWHALQRKYPQFYKNLKGKIYTFIHISDGYRITHEDLDERASGVVGNY